MIAAGSRLGPDETHRLRGAPRPITLADLGEIAKCGEAVERYEVVAALAEGRAKSAGAARRAWKAQRAGVQPKVKDPVEDQFRALMAVWNRAGVPARKRFCLEAAREIWAAQNKGASLASSGKPAPTGEVQE